MSKKLYVGNIPYSATDEGLEQLFSHVGTVVSAKVITDRVSGRSRGFGFVEMATEEEAEEAISKFNDADFQGRNMKVNEARPPVPREQMVARNGYSPRQP